MTSSGHGDAASHAVSRRMSCNVFAVYAINMMLFESTPESVAPRQASLTHAPSSPLASMCTSVDGGSMKRGPPSPHSSYPSPCNRSQTSIKPNICFRRTSLRINVVALNVITVGGS